MPEIGTYVFMDSMSLTKVVMPQATAKLEKGLFYDCGINDFSTSGTVKNLEEIDDFALFGSTFETLDLSPYTKLKRLGSHALAYRDLNRKPNARTSRNANNSVKTIILPNNIENGTLELGDFLLRGAYHFDTLKVKDRESCQRDGVVSIPDYVTNASCVGGTFSATAVKEAFWEYTTTGKNPWTYIPESMFNATDVADISKCLLPVSDLKEIKASAFLGCRKLTTIDIRAYENLETIGESVFGECLNLQDVYMAPNIKKLPNYAFFVGYYDEITSSGGYYSCLQYVDLANIAEIGDYCFGSVNLKDDTAGSGTKQYVIWPSVLQAIDLSNVTKIGTGVFWGQTNLKTVKFNDSLKEIGNRVFLNQYRNSRGCHKHRRICVLQM